MITNTSKLPTMLQLATSMPGGIEASEARGQRELVESTQLPSEMSVQDRKTLEAAGIIFGQQSPGDELFITATLPFGWKKRPTDHPMWSELVDGEGKVIANIFYKAAFYDRRASIQVIALREPALANAAPPA